MHAELRWILRTALPLLWLPTHLPAQDPPELSLLASWDGAFARMLAAIQPDHRFEYDREQQHRFGDLYLLQAVPVVPVAGTAPDESYFDSERPSTGLVTSFAHDRMSRAVPIEHALVYARRLSPGTLVFRCLLFTSEQRSPADPTAGPPLCQGRFDLRTGSLEFEFIDLLFDRTENRLRGLPSASCVQELYPVEVQRNECASLGILLRLRCSLASKLFARHRCRPLPVAAN